MNDNFINEIKSVNKNIIILNTNLKNLNTMKLNGTVKYLIKPTSFIELKKVLIIIKKNNIKFNVIGNGSNIIFTNKEKECLIKLNFKKNNDDRIIMSNELIPVKSNEFLNKGYLGLEYLSMIPASFGGAIVMNASAYSHSISDIIEYVYFIDENFNFNVINKEFCNFKYRGSIFKERGYIVLGCKVKLIKSEYNKIKNIMNDYGNKRKLSQPTEYPNCGSIFKNTNINKAWELIDKVNLKGYVKNGAMISDKHCNFIVNFNNASYQDIIFLITLIEKKVYEKLNIKLEREVIILD